MDVVGFMLWSFLRVKREPVLVFSPLTQLPGARMNGIAATNEKYSYICGVKATVASF